MLLRALIAVLTIITFSCKSQKSTIEESENSNGLELLIADAYFLTEERQAMVVESEKELRAFFVKVNSTRKPGLPVPNIDFSNEVVLVICASEQQGNAIPRPELRKRASKEVIFDIVMVDDSAQKDTKAITTYPFAVYKMQKPHSGVVFHWD